MDFDTVAQTFQSIATGGSALRNQLTQLTATSPTTPAQQQAISDLVALAQQGVEQLTQAARDSRAKRIAELTVQIDAITDALATPLESPTRDHLSSIQNSLLAERAQLEIVDVSDFSHVVSPDFVQKLIVQLSAAQSEVATKKKAGAAIAILGSAAQVAIQIAGFVLAAAG